MRTLNRRDLLRGAAAGAVVVGWDPVARSWATASTGGTALIGVPPLDGVLLTDPASKSLAADDWGHIVHHEPFAVLRPLSVQDIVKMVDFAGRHNFRVSMRGQGHSSFGQSQAAGGIVIDSATLNGIHDIGSDRVTVEPGALWRSVVLATAARGLTPPALTDYLDLSVGGTLSMGGINGGPSPHGAQVDNVLELDVVTGAGELVTCSPGDDLFDAVLGGLGQCGVIVRATVRLVPMPTHALLVQAIYEDLDDSLADMAMLVRRDRNPQFSSIEQWGRWVTGKGWVYQCSAAAYFTPPHVPDSAALVRGLRDTPTPRVITTIPYLTWVFRDDAIVVASRALRYALFNGFVPEAAAPGFFSATDGVFSQNNQQLGADAVLFTPISRHQMKRPLLSLADSEVQHGLGIFRRVRDDAQKDQFLKANRALWVLQRDLGGKRYPWDAIPEFTENDWAEHYGKSWSFFRRCKKRFDPAGILGPGSGVFG